MLDWSVVAFLLAFAVGSAAGWGTAEMLKKIVVKAVGDSLREHLTAINDVKGTLMATLDETLEVVTASNTKLDSVIALVDGLKKQLADAMVGATLPPETQSKIDAIFATATANAGKIADALDENV